MTVLSAEAPFERALAQEIRQAALTVIEDHGIAATAKMLEMAPSGVKALTWRQEWPIDMALRVAEALKLDVPKLMTDLAAKNLAADEQDASQPT